MVDKKAQLTTNKAAAMSKFAPSALRTEPAPITVLTTQAESRRSWLTEEEVERLIKAAKTDRDKAMLLIAYRHGLRVSELVNLQWRQVDLAMGRLQVTRLKNGDDSVHPINGREIRLLHKLRRQQPIGSRHVFESYQGAPMTRQAFYKLLAKAGAAAGIPDAHPHLLRHGCGFKLVNQGVDTLSLAAYLRHRNVQNTKHYTRRSSTRFDGFWKD